MPTASSTPPLYLVEVQAAIESPARIGASQDKIYAHTSISAKYEPATVWAADGERAPYWKKNHELRRVALYTSQALAQAAVYAGQLWNGQTYRIREAHGEQKDQGVVIA